MSNAKLGRANNLRKAMLRNQVTALLWHGKIETTMARAKEVRSIAEKLIPLAMDVHDQNVMVTKDITNSKGQIVPTEVRNDKPAKLAVRRRLMTFLYTQKELKNPKESKKEYKARTKDVKHPCVEKLFQEIGPKYKQRNADKGCAGGYTRILKLGPRRGDAAEMVILELV